MLPRTPEQNAAALAQMKQAVGLREGWKHVKGWIFHCPRGIPRDLSASSPTALESIEKNYHGTIWAEIVN